MKRLTTLRMVSVSGILIFTAALFSFSSRNSVAFENASKQGSPLPAPHHIIWGASSAGFIGEKVTDIESWKRLNERIKSANGGYALEGRRTYDKGIPASWSASAMASDEGLCNVSFGSFKPNWSETVNGTNNEAIKKFIQSIPNDRIVYLTFFHEPENDETPINTKDMLLRAFAKFVDIVLTSGKPNVHPCFVLMTWTFKAESKRNSDDYNLAKYLKPGQAKEVIAGLDGYAGDPAVSAKDLFEPGFTKIATWGFTKFGIFETGDHVSPTSPTLRSSWIKDFGKWVIDRRNIELVSWFNNGNGPHAGPKGWYLGTWSKDGDKYTWGDKDGTLSAYAQLLKK